MTKLRTIPFLLGAVIATVVTTPPSYAQSRNQTYLDLEAGGGYSTNPFLQPGDSVGAGFGRISAYGFHGWGNERGSSSISAYVENSTYWRRYSSKQIFSVNAATSRALSEKVRAYANLGFSGDIGAQLSSRFYGAPLSAVQADPNLPDAYTVVIDPDVYALNRRQYRVNGNAGASITLSPRDSLDLSAGAQYVFFNRNGDQLNYTQYDGSIGYRRQISEFVSIGVRGIATRADYKLGRSVTTYGPQATLDARLGQNLTANVAVGFVRNEQNRGTFGSDYSSTDLAVGASLCRNLEYSRLCARVSRRTQGSVVGASPTTSSAGLDWSQRLSAKDQVQASLAVVQTGRTRDFGIGKSTFYSASGSYDRQISDRFAAGVNVSARKLTQFGPNPKTDVGGSFFLRYRLGNIR